MKKSIRALAMLLAVGAMVGTSQAITVLNEDFESYSDGDSLAVLSGWTGNVTNQEAFVTNNGTSLVAEFTGSEWGLVGVSIPGYAPAADSKLLSDYTIEFDVEKTEGSGTSPEVEVSVPGAGLVRMNYTDPTIGGGQTHVSLNLANNIFVDSGFTLSGAGAVDLVFKSFGGADGVRQTYQIDNIVLSVEPSPFIKLECLPTGSFIDSSAMLSATYEDNAAEVDSMTLYLDGSLMVSSSSYAGGSVTNTITYEATGLAVGVHTAKVVVADSGSNSVTNEWSFKLIGDDPTIEVGAEDFESYATGTWNSVTYPNPNPALGGGAQSAVIVDSGSTNGLELQVDGNLSNQWSSGVTFDMDLSGLNKSKNIDDYTVTVLVRFDDGSQDLSNTGFEMTIYNKDEDTQGNIYNFGNFDSTGLDAIRAGSVARVFSIPLGVIDARPYGKDDPMDPSSVNWRLWFGANNNLAANDKPITFTIDDIIVSYTKPTFLNPSYAPVGITTNDPLMTATVIDGTSEVDTMELYLDGALVASDIYAGGSTTNTISYAAVGASGGSHTGAVVYADAGTNVATNVWTFIVPSTPLPPSTNPLELYNINIAGCANNGIRPVPDGVVLAAPSTGGSNLWNNASSPNAPWGNPGLLTLAGANEGSSNTVGFETGGSGWWDGPQSWAGYFSEFTALSNTIWGATVGDSDLGWTRFTGLDTNATYDVYVYWTWNRNDDARTYNLTVGTANMPQLTLDSDRASVVANPTNYLEGTNYVVFTAVTPNASGTIQIEPNYSCAWQLVKRGPDAGGPTVDPDILTVSMSGGMLSLLWNSENGVTYKVLGKSKLTDASWTEVTNGIPGAGATTSISVPVGSSQEFFMIEGR